MDAPPIACACGNANPPGSRFCEGCGNPLGHDASSWEAGTGAAGAAPSAFGVLPIVPCSFIWSKRAPWVVRTRLSARRISELFSATMFGRPPLRRRLLFGSPGAFFRRTTWRIERSEDDTEAIAEAVGEPIAVGIGQSQAYIDPTGDTIEMVLDWDGDESAEVTFGVGVYSRYWQLRGLIRTMAFPFPMLSYCHNFAKALKQEDPGAAVRYPWSIVRILFLLGAIAWALTFAVK